MTKTVYWYKFTYMYYFGSNKTLLFVYLFSSLGHDCCQALRDWLNHFPSQPLVPVKFQLLIFFMLSFRELRFVISFSSNLCLMIAQMFSIGTLEQRHHSWSDKALKGTIVNRALPYLNWGSLEITLTVSCRRPETV